MKSNSEDATAPIALTVFIIIFLLLFVLILFSKGGFFSSCGRIYKVIVEERKKGDEWVETKRKTVIQGGNNGTTLPSPNDYDIL